MNNPLLQKHWPLLVMTAAIIMGAGAAGALAYTVKLKLEVSRALETAQPSRDEATSAAKDKPDAPDGRSEERSEERGDDSRKALPEPMAKLMREKAIFGKQPKEQAQLEAIFDDRAKISGNWMGVGDEQGPFKLLAIGVFGVEILDDGATRTLTLYKDLRGAEGENQEEGESDPSLESEEHSPDGSSHSRYGDRQVSPKAGASKSSDSPGKSAGRALPNLSPEMIEQFRQRMEKASPEEQQRIRERLEQRLQER
jgi:hypothetical protein